MKLRVHLRRDIEYTYLKRLMEDFICSQNISYITSREMESGMVLMSTVVAVAEDVIEEAGVLYIKVRPVTRPGFQLNENMLVDISAWASINEAIHITCFHIKESGEKHGEEISKE